MLNKKLLIRVVLLAAALLPLFFWRSFYLHFYGYLSGNVVNRLITRQWRIVVINIILFAAFLIPLSFRRRAKWTEYGLVAAFFISMFVEMYGIPLTVLLASRYLAAPAAALPPNVIEFNLLNVGFGMDLAMAYGAVLIIIGTILILVGWVTLFTNIKSQPLVTKGIYAYSRHPQYLGFIMVVYGWLLGWPTYISLIFAPILIYKYIQVSRTEEREITATEHVYSDYRRQVPFFI